MMDQTNLRAKMAKKNPDYLCLTCPLQNADPCEGRSRWQSEGSCNKKLHALSFDLQNIKKEKK